MRKIAIKSFLSILLVLTLVGCACEHEWQEATCTAPKTCTLCGETEGEANGHTWANATCTLPQTCLNCGAIEGEALGHSWIEATCTEPKKCSTCNVTEGDPLGHTAGELEFKENNYINATAVYVNKCTICNQDVSTIEESLETLHNEELFDISPYDFYERLKKVYSEIDDSMDIRKGTNGDKFVCGYLRDDKQIGIIQFSNETGNITSDQKDDTCFDSIMGIISDDISDVLASLVLTLDPTQTDTDALAIALSTCANGEKEVNGITYQCQPGGNGGGIIWVKIAK